MWWRTYQREIDEIRVAEERAEGLFIVSATRFLDRVNPHWRGG